MSKKVFIVGEVLFLLFIVICIGLIYIVHKYFGKYEFYFLGVIYTVISFLMSFKLINIFGGLYYGKLFIVNRLLQDYSRKYV